MENAVVGDAEHFDAVLLQGAKKLRFVDTLDYDQIDIRAGSIVESLCTARAAQAGKSAQLPHPAFHLRCRARAIH